MLSQYVVPSLLLTLIATTVIHAREQQQQQCCSSSTATMGIVDSLLLHWIPNGLVPLYTLAVVLYLSLRFYYDRYVVRTRRPKETTDEAAAAAATESYDESSQRRPQPVDMTGRYRLVENHNFEALLQAQGVPWFLVSAASKARPTHHLTHRGDALTIKIQGIIESETTYIVNGPSIETNIRGRLFRDTMTYLRRRDSFYDQQQQKEQQRPSSQNGSDDQEEEKKEGDDPNAVIVGVQTEKRAVDDGYTIFVQRRLSDDQTQIIMTSYVKFDDTTKGDVQSTQIFQRMQEEG
jgi:hypothetical protein